MTALQGDTRSNLVQAPKVTTINGAAAFINSANVINYVAQLIPIVGAGSVAFAPIPSQINDGVFLQATPVVSADRRYTSEDDADADVQHVAHRASTRSPSRRRSAAAASAAGPRRSTARSSSPNFTNNTVSTIW